MNEKKQAIIKKYLPFTIPVVRAIRTLREFAYRAHYNFRIEKIPYVRENPFHKTYNDKVIIVTPGCSGKSTFAKKNIYKGIKVKDDLYKYWDRKGSYQEFRSAFLREYPGRICALDPFYKIKLEKEIQHIAVLIPKEKVIEYYKVRRGKAHYACILRDILKLRKEILSFAIKNEVPIYPSFEEALDDVVESGVKEDGQTHFEDTYRKI